MSEPTEPSAEEEARGIVRECGHVFIVETALDGRVSQRGACADCITTVLAKRDAEVDEQHWAAESWRQRAEAAEAQVEIRQEAIKVLAEDVSSAEARIADLESALRAIIPKWDDLGPYLHREAGETMREAMDHAARVLAGECPSKP